MRSEYICKYCGTVFARPSSLAKQGRAKFCSQVCRRAYSHEQAESGLERFWSYVDKTGPVPEHRPELGQCWVWTGQRVYAYGKFYRDHHHYRAHRFSYELAYGAISEGLNVLHKCDNPPCVRPSHLFLGSHTENVADRHAKGRDAKGERSATHMRPEIRQFGERNRGAKLTEAQVLKIRQLRSEGASPFDLAKSYGVNHMSIWRIVTRRSWKHLP